MPAKQVKHVSVELELSGVFREKTGADALDASTIHYMIAQHIAKQMKKDVNKLPDRFWGRIVFVTNIILQTVSLDGKGRFDIPTVDASAEDITDFYDFMMSSEITEKQIIFFQDGLRKFDPVPLATGGQDEAASKNGSQESQTTETTTLTPA